MLTKTIFVLLFVCFAILSCDKEEIIMAHESPVDELTVTQASVKVPPSFVVIQENPDGPPMGPFTDVPGTSSILRRNKNGITVDFKTTGLIPGNAYTLWFIVFGENPGPPIIMTYATGHVVGKSGKGNFSAHLSAGEIFDKPLTAEVHLALRSHGPMQPEMMPDQILTIDGGCRLPDIGFPSGPALYPDAEIVGYCANVQVAMHPKN